MSWCMRLCSPVLVAWLLSWARTARPERTDSEQICCIYCTPCAKLVLDVLCPIWQQESKSGEQTFRRKVEEAHRSWEDAVQGLCVAERDCSFCMILFFCFCYSYWFLVPDQIRREEGILRGQVLGAEVFPDIRSLLSMLRRLWGIWPNATVGNLPIAEDTAAIIHPILVSCHRYMGQSLTTKWFPQFHN